MDLQEATCNQMERLARACGMDAVRGAVACVEERLAKERDEHGERFSNGSDFVPPGWMDAEKV